MSTVKIVVKMDDKNAVKQHFTASILNHFLLKMMKHVTLLKLLFYVTCSLSMTRGLRARISSISKMLLWLHWMLNCARLCRYLPVTIPVLFFFLLGHPVWGIVPSWTGIRDIFPYLPVFSGFETFVEWYSGFPDNVVYWIDDLLRPLGPCTFP